MSVPDAKKCHELPKKRQNKTPCAIKSAIKKKKNPNMPKSQKEKAKKPKNAMKCE